MIAGMVWRFGVIVLAEGQLSSTGRRSLACSHTQWETG